MAKKKNRNKQKRPVNTPENHADSVAVSDAPHSQSTPQDEPVGPSVPTETPQLSSSAEVNESTPKEETASTSSRKKSTTTDEEASQKDKNKKRKEPINAEDIKGIVLRKIHFARIDGRLCYHNGKYFVPVKSQSEIESLIYNTIPGILQGGSIRLLKDAAYIIYRLHRFEDTEPAESHGYLGFNNGIYVYNPKTGQEYSFTHFDSEVMPSYPPSEEDDAYIDVTVSGPAGQILPCKMPSPKPVADSEVPIKITHLLNVNFAKQYSGMCIDGTLAYPTVINYKPSIPFPYPIETRNFFSSIANGDNVLITRIWEMLACILVPDPSVKKFFLLEGLPDSGKSVLGNFIKSFFHTENVSSLDFSRLGDKYSASVLPGTYLNVSMDLPNQTISTKSIAMLKMLTGDDDITIEAKFQDARSYRNRSRFLFASNHHLKLAEDDQAFVNRLVLIPFQYTPNQKDPNLLNKLKAERDSVAAWAIQYYFPIIKSKNYVFSGTGDPKYDPVIIASERYTNMRLSHLQTFTDKYCRVTDTQQDFVYMKKIYERYLDFCKSTNFTEYCDYNHFTPLFKKVIGDGVAFHRHHTIFKEDGESIDVNQACCFRLKMIEDPMTFDLP